MDKKILKHGSALCICYLVERDRHPELHHFLVEVKKNDLSAYKKTFNTIERLKDYPEQLKTLQDFKKLQTNENIWELKVTSHIRLFLFYSAENEVCITHGYRKQRKNDKRLQKEIEKAIRIKQRYYDE